VCNRTVKLWTIFIYSKGLNWSEILILRLVGLHQLHAVQSEFRLPAQNLL